MATEKQFNYLNFFYGLGATIILIAAVFKFLGLRYFNYVFVVGIIIEAMVFLVSAFDWSGDDKGYEWEKVFPQLDENGLSDYTSNQVIAEGTQQQQVQKIMESLVTLNSSVSELNAATQKLTKSLEIMEKNYEIVSESTQKYQTEIDSLRSKISAANSQLKVFDKFNYNN